MMNEFPKKIRPKRSRPKRKWMAMALLAGAMIFAPAAPQVFHLPQVFDPPRALAHWAAGHRGAPSSWKESVNRAAPGFTLVDQKGRPLSLSNLRGKAILLNFGFTSCTDLCPLQTANMLEVLRRIGPGVPVHAIMITTDPEVDRIKVLRAYGRRYGIDTRNWSFLTGPREALQKVWSAYGVSVAPLARGLVDHNYVLALIDAGGNWRATYHGEAWDVKRVAEDFRKILPRPLAMRR